MNKLHNKLWPHQLEAIKNIKKYLRSDGNNNRAALIQMPTGTGKSGVIAIVCQHHVKGSILVVVPWVALRQQLAKDIRKRFWENIGYNKQSPKEVIEFTASSINNALQKARDKEVVFICNAQSLTKLYTKQYKTYEKLKEKIKLVIFDEGHREPAIKWARAIRELKMPTILFTATPYRNDNRIFNIDKQFVYQYSYIKALKEHYVRDVKFHYKKWNNAERFVKIVLKCFNDIKRELGLTPKTIIRCNTSNEILEIAKILKDKGKKVIAIHESFKTDGECTFSSVPQKDIDAIFWIHQNKLIEGIDDSSFCILAIYGPFKNARSLIQQIGRITRNPKRAKNQTAHVIINDYKQQKFWMHYCDYENNEQPIFNDDILQRQSYYGYFEKDFLEPFNMKSSEFYKHIRYRLAAYCFKVNNRFSLKELEKELSDEWSRIDFNIRNIAKLKDTRIFLYTIDKNSPILLDRCHIEHNLGFTICKKINSYLFFYDSNGKMCEYLVKNTDRIESSKLQYLYEKDARLTELSLLNADVGKYSIRRRVIEAHSILDTVPSLSDFAHIPSTANGFIKLGKDDKKITRRYIGFSRSRISDQSSEDIDYKMYVEWLKNLAKILDSPKVDISPIFNRYARLIEPPSDPTPRSILLDISDVEEYFENIDSKESLKIEEPYADVNNCEFTLTINSNSYNIKIEYDSKTQRYKLHSDDLAKFIRKESAPHITDNIVQYLNREQPFRIVVKTRGIIYANGHFYEPRDISDRFNIGTILIPIKELKDIEKEKDVVDDNKWSSDSLFGVIDALGKSTDMEEYLKDMKILVCDDMGKEMADFIAANDKKVIFIHAKASDEPHKTSAAALHVICSQAVKNLKYLHPMEVVNCENIIKKWKRPWIRNNKTIERIREGPSDPKVVWEEISNVIRAPTTSKEVWIVVSRTLSLKTFNEEINNRNYKPEIIQILYLLLSTWRSVSEVGATLRIFCSP